MSDNNSSQGPQQPYQDPANNDNPAQTGSSGDNVTPVPPQDNEQAKTQPSQARQPSAQYEYNEHTQPEQSSQPQPPYTQPAQGQAGYGQQGYPQPDYAQTSNQQQHPYAQATGQQSNGQAGYTTGYGYAQSPQNPPPQPQPNHYAQTYLPQGAYYPPPVNQSWNTLSIVGFILSFFLYPVGLVLSIVALVQINKTGEKSKALSIAGIIIGALFTVVTVFVVAAIFWAFGQVGSYINSYNNYCSTNDCSSYSYSYNGTSAREWNPGAHYLEPSGA